MGRGFCFAGLLVAASAALAQGGERTLTLAPKQRTTAETRHALVIGNSAYASGPLRNPVNDARAMAKALGETGFHVTLVENATQAGMQRAIRELGSALSKGGVGLFYYAGHGIQVKGRNFLVPVNADIAQEYEVEYSAVDAGLVLAMMEAAKNPLNIVILDACRNNPFQRSWRSAPAGLAQMDAPSGSFIAFATAPGSVAADGSGDHGTYTKHLLAEMARPGVPIERMFKQVRTAVMSETRNRQIPWESSSLRGEFAFRPAAARPSLPAVDPAAIELSFWDSVKTSSNEADLRAYLEQYPGGKFSPLAKSRLELLLASTAPLGPAGIRLPRAGDTWVYRLRARQRAIRERSYVVRVAASAEVGIVDWVTVDGDIPAESRHGKGSYLVSQGVILLSPYLGLFEDLRPGMALRNVDMGDDPTCRRAEICMIEGKVVGREAINTLAGKFDAVKVTFTQLWRASVQGRQSPSREVSAWYAPEAKRVVRVSSRSVTGDAIQPDFDLELVSYKLQ
jgi:hypothetical protein